MEEGCFSLAKGRAPAASGKEELGARADRITGASRAPQGTKAGLMDKLKGSVPNMGINRLYKLTF